MNELKWIERFEMKWVNWRSDLEQPYGNGPMVRRRCPYESDLSEPNGNLPMSWEWVSLSIWLDWSQWESPYVQLNECPYESDLEQPYGNGPMVDWECPYQSDWNEPYEKVPIKMNELKWIERFEVIWVIWRKWARTTLWESPYGQ